MIVPFQMVMYPMTQVANMLFLDNMFGIIFIYLGFGAGLSVFMFTGFCKSIPLEIEEAAMIDGLSRFQVIYKIILPLSVPAISSAFIYVFMIAWNDFLFSFTFLSSQSKLTLAVGLKQLFGSMDYVWGRMMAAALLTAIPVIITFSAVEKFISGGLTAGGEKG